MRGSTLPPVKRILVLGSTGSIGTQTLEVIAADPDMAVCGLSCGRRTERMLAQASEHGVRLTCAPDGRGSVPWQPDLSELIERSAPDLVVNAIVGAAGLRPTLAALERGIDVALANKESLVVGGDLVAEARRGARLVPIDSEHSALFQLLAGVEHGRITSCVLTASGGPFRGMEPERIAAMGPADALAHPTWSMGAKITVDSATMMNKGLELIEAHHLFDLSYDRLEVVVHPQSLVHAMVRLDDGSVVMHAGPPDMRVPIGHALRHPSSPPPRSAFDLTARSLTFEAPDAEAFPCLAIAREAGRTGGLTPAIMNAANEVAVQAFLDERITFGEIAGVVRDALDGVGAGRADSLEAVLDADSRARDYVDGALAGREPLTA